jgi:hypothetical protein
VTADDWRMLAAVFTPLASAAVLFAVCAWVMSG